MDTHGYVCACYLLFIYEPNKNNYFVVVKYTHPISPQFSEHAATSKLNVARKSVWVVPIRDSETEYGVCERCNSIDLLLHCYLELKAARIGGIGVPCKEKFLVCWLQCRCPGFVTHRPQLGRTVADVEVFAVDANVC